MGTLMTKLMQAEQKKKKTQKALLYTDYTFDFSFYVSIVRRFSTTRQSR